MCLFLCHLCAIDKTLTQYQNYHVGIASIRCKDVLRHRRNVAVKYPNMSLNSTVEDFAGEFRLYMHLNDYLLEFEIKRI